jgi:hypothetical protein
MYTGDDHLIPAERSSDVLYVAVGVRLHDPAHYLGMGSGCSCGQYQSKQRGHKDYPHLRIRKIQHCSFSLERLAFFCRPSHPFSGGEMNPLNREDGKSRNTPSHYEELIPASTKSTATF